MHMISVFLFMMVGGVGQIAKELDFEAVEKRPAQKPKHPTNITQRKSHQDLNLINVISNKNGTKEKHIGIKTGTKINNANN